MGLRRGGRVKRPDGEPVQHRLGTWRWRDLVELSGLTDAEARRAGTRLHREFNPRSLLSVSSWLMRKRGFVCRAPEDIIPLLERLGRGGVYVVFLAPDGEVVDKGELVE